MGFDKPDLGFVVHLGAPPSPIAYYQQVGRAGRAVEHAEVVLLPGAEDAAIWRYFASLAFPPEEQVRSVLANLSPDRPLSTQALEPLVDLRRARLELMLKVLDVDGAVRRTRGGWLATGEPWTYDTARLRRVAEARTAEQQTMLEYASTTACRMEFLRRCLDDPEAKPCGRCDTCAEPLFDAEVSPSRWPPRTPSSAARASRSPRRRCGPPAWTRSACRSRARSRRPSRSRPAAPSGRLSDLGWGGRLRALVAPEAAGRRRSPTTSPRAVVEVLKAWAHGDDGWAQRPAAVVAVGSGTPPAAGPQHSPSASPRSAGCRCSARSRRPTSPTPGPRGNSAQRVRALHDAFTVPPELAAALADAGRAGPAGRRPGRLRLDDGAGRPRAAPGGRPAVLPLALAVAG